MGKDSGGQDQWEFPALRNGLTGLQKKLVMAKVMKTAVLAIFKTHTYSFGGRFYHQQRGGPIGLRSTCCIARLVMLWWDDELVLAMEKMNIKMVAGARYMDDIRVWLHAIRLGWRIIDGELMFRREWLEEERKENMTPLQKTTVILEEVMNGICGWLNLTMETEDMFGGTLPTLDLQIWIRDDNKILYKYYEKAMIPITVIHARSAIPESTRRATLNQELIRRLTNTSELLDDGVRIMIVDEYAQKLVNSEYTVKRTQGFILGGLKGYERLLSLSRDTTNPRWKPLHMSASWNSRNRRVAKQLSKSSWYKGKTEVEPPSPSSHQGGRSNQEDVNKDMGGTGDHASTGEMDDERVLNSSGIEFNKTNTEKGEPEMKKTFQKAGQSQ